MSPAKVLLPILSSSWSKRSLPRKAWDKRREEVRTGFVTPKLVKKKYAKRQKNKVRK